MWIPRKTLPQPGNSNESLVSFSPGFRVRQFSFVSWCLKHLKLLGPVYVQGLQWQPCSQSPYPASVGIIREIPGSASRGSQEAEVVGPRVWRGAEVPKPLGNRSASQTNWDWVSREGELARWHEVGDKGREKDDGEEENSPHDFKGQEHECSVWERSVTEVWVAGQLCCVNRIRWKGPHARSGAQSVPG